MKIIIFKYCYKNTRINTYLNKNNNIDNSYSQNKISNVSF